MWLNSMGAHVHGYSLDPPTQPSVFEVISVASALASDSRADLADLAKLSKAMSAAEPEIVFHLAAQPLVLAGYDDPIGTFSTNVLGTAHVLQAIRSVPSIKAVVIVTTDKVYENKEWVHPYRENDRLGGHDPYSASKAAVEIITSSMRDSFLKTNGVCVASARAGNVIGGGDWAANRLIPDCLKSFEKSEPVRLRFPKAVRPWQHVLEPLGGYIRLAAALFEDGESFSKAWNFGPDPTDDAAVGDVAQRLAVIWGEGTKVVCEQSTDHRHEAGLLTLDNSAARNFLGWEPRWSLDEALAKTVSWHRAWLSGNDMRKFTLGQIRDYQEAVVR